MTLENQSEREEKTFFNLFLREGVLAAISIDVGQRDGGAY